MQNWIRIQIRNKNLGFRLDQKGSDPLRFGFGSATLTTRLASRILLIEKNIIKRIGLAGAYLGFCRVDAQFWLTYPPPPS
jgi:hypothetical protein